MMMMMKTIGNFNLDLVYFFEKQIINNILLQPKINNYNLFMNII